MSTRKNIPVSFVATRLAVNEATLCVLLDITDRTPKAQKAVIARNAKSFGIEKIHGGLWPYWDWVRALEGGGLRSEGRMADF